MSLEPEVKARGELMAQEDLRSFSNFLTWLLDEEWKRRHPQVDVNGENIEPVSGISDCEKAEESA